MLTKARVREWLEARFFLRIHMTLILGGTFLAGLIATRLLMEAGVDRLAVRYLIAVAAAYFVFLILIRLWLSYVGSGGDSHFDLAGDGIDIGMEVIPDAPLPKFQGSGSGGSWSDGISLGGDLEDIVVIVLLLVLVVCLCGFAIYFIWTAPALLSEAAFEAALAASLARRTKNVAGGNWMGSVFRATAAPFLVVLVLSGFLGWAAQRKCPEARRMREALSCSSRLEADRGVVLPGQHLD
ncbi:MAG TPA: hypothetical protein VEO54_20130 [Thermoanaerobaculia bacterium]|nr:hypothetical protein [Thermoanaerobaculia bacterium]